MVGAMWNRVASWRWKWRLVAKVGAFLAIALLVLFPRLDLAWKQAWQLRDWDALIDPNIGGMPEINAEIDRRLPAGATAAQEMAAVQKFVYERISYCYDWFNWANVDYWPTAAEVWARQREDCDGRAVLCASILRARGFSTARLAGSLSHVWVMIDPNDPKAAATRVVGLMTPQKSETYSRRNGRVVIRPPEWQTVWPALIDFSRFPAWRAAILVLSALVLLFHPCRHGGGFGLICTMAMLGLAQFYHWGARARGTSEPLPGWELGVGFGLVLASVIIATAAHPVSRRRKSPAMTPAALPQT
jgi:hypothetical protein